jgi:arylmalonate decarboxylase
MTRTRRDFVRVGFGAAVYGALAVPADALQNSGPALGLIFPPLDYPIPPDANRLYPKGVQFLGDGVGLPGGMTLEGYEEAIPRVVPVAQALVKRGAKVVSVFGSSLTFYKGAKFHEDLIQQVAKATGMPATTQSNGLLDGLRTVGAKRVALATAYTDIVTERLKIFLQEYGFEVTSARGLGYIRVPEEGVPQEVLIKLGADAYAAAPRADAVVMSCGGLRTLDLLVPLEGRVKVPVVSSTPHGLMNGVRLLGVNPRVQGFGIVFSRA